MLDKLKDLIDLKSIVTLVLIIGLTVGFFMDKIDAQNYFTVVTMVVTYYFSKKDSDTKEEPKDVEGEL